MNVRFTAFSISSTHMKTMIAFRRMSTPKTPITNSTAEKKSASASMFFPSLLAEHDSAHDRRQEQNARDLEREQILVEERPRKRRDGPRLLDLFREISGRQREERRQLGPRDGGDLREDRDTDCPGDDLPAHAPDVGWSFASAEVEQHDHEQEHDHDRAGVDQHLDHADELRVEHHVE